jgi:hypothetical protein
MHLFLVNTSGNAVVVGGRGVSIYICIYIYICNVYNYIYMNI